VVTSEAQLASLLRGSIANVLAAGFFLFICFIAFSIAVVRPRKSARLLVWLGIWSGMYGAQELLKLGPVVESLPVSLQAARQTLLVSFNYLIIVAGALVFLEMTLGMLHRLVQLHLVADVAVAIAAISLFVVSGSQNSLLVYNQLLVIILLVAIVLTVSIPSLSRRFFVVTRHRVLTIGSLIFTGLALWVNVAPILHMSVPNICNSVGFAIFLLSIGYTGVEIMVADERRLLLLDDELAIARQLQFSILPERIPKIAGLEIAAIYKPMSAVAGDFYEFLAVDERHVGFLVADVSGHGVPAALIASMIKVAGQAANGCTSDPAQVLRTVGSILNKNVRGQLVSAAYLWIDMAGRTAAYSAAGHPPLVRWRTSDRTFTRIESNGLPFGIDAVLEYPVCNFPLVEGDRFLLCTDGVTEPENEAGQQFGESRLEQLIRENQSRSVSEISELLPAEIRKWQASNVAQQDDITLILIDVLENVKLQPYQA
jgi:phosphoserine phosphatase RsbU/P